MDTMSEAMGVRTDDDAQALVIRLFRAESARLVQMARWFVDDRTAAEVIAAGANILVAGSYIYNSPSYLEAIESLKIHGR